MPRIYLQAFFYYQLNQLIILNINFGSYLYAFTLWKMDLANGMRVDFWPMKYGESDKGNIIFHNCTFPFFFSVAFGKV